MSDWPQPTPADPAAAGQPVPDAPYPFWTYVDIAVVLAALLVASVLATFAGVLLIALPLAVITAVVQAIIYVAGIYILYLVIRKRYGQPFLEGIRWPLGKSSLALWGGAGILTAVGSSLIGLVAGVQNLESNPMTELLASSRATLLVIGLLAVTIGPIFEELIFRGFLQPLLARGMGPAPAILIAATLFGLPHAPQNGWAWQAVVPIIFAGACFGIARQVSGSTGIAAGMHAMYNLTIFAAYIAQGGSQIP